MKKGDYVRDKDGNIDKFIGKREKRLFTSNTLTSYASTMEVNVYENDNIKNTIVKSSSNIIDLIEENDLLKIEYFSLRYNERVTRLFEVTFKDGEYINLSNAKCEFMLINGEFNKGDKELEPIIKSIVTKEQFNSMEYRI